MLFENCACQTYRLDRLSKLKSLMEKEPISFFHQNEFLQNMTVDTMCHSQVL